MHGRAMGYSQTLPHANMCGESFHSFFGSFVSFFCSTTLAAGESRCINKYIKFTWRVFPILTALNGTVARTGTHKMRHYNADYFSIALKMTQKIINIYNHSCIQFHISAPLRRTTREQKHRMKVLGHQFIKAKKEKIGTLDHFPHFLHFKQRKKA